MNELFYEAGRIDSESFHTQPWPIEEHVVVTSELQVKQRYTEYMIKSVYTLYA